jgi:hypothetical protein
LRDISTEDAEKIFEYRQDNFQLNVAQAFQPAILGSGDSAPTPFVEKFFAVRQEFEG